MSLRRNFISAGLGILSAATWVVPRPAFAADVDFSARVDRTEISQDESVALKLSVKAEGMGASLDSVEIDAPDFDLVNEYTSTFVESYYSNGSFGVKNNRTLTKVLRPKKQGMLTISGIRAKVDGEIFTADPITITVTAGGAGTPPPSGYGGGGAGLRGAGKRTNSNAFFVRAEVDKQKLYEGEQLVVSYYLYRRARVFNIQVDKYPALSGFLREDLEMPVLGQRLDSEQVVLDGVPYERSLLVQYAAYPLQEGKLKIDPMAIRAAYYGEEQRKEEEADPMDPFSDPFRSFFQQMTPRTGTSRSEPVTVEVLPLPEDGRPDSFSGGVGDFSVTGAIDKYQVRAHEALTLTVKVEGKGNVSSIEEPPVNWPEQLEVYEAKSRTKTTRAGVGEKIFEFLLIPREEGSMSIPPVEFSFFDPAEKKYVTRQVEPFEIKVLPAAPGTAPQTPKASSSSRKKGQSPSGEKMTLAGLKARPKGERSWLAGQAAWQWLSWICLAGVLGFFTWVGVDQARRRKNGKAVHASSGSKPPQYWNELKSRKDASWNEVSEAYEKLSDGIYDALDCRYAIGARSRSRAELRKVLVEEKGLSSEQWEKIANFLEFEEMVRFASSAGAVSQDAARSELPGRVDEVRSIHESLLGSS